MSLSSEAFLFYDFVLLVGIVFVLWRSYYKGFLQVFLDAGCFFVSFIVAAFVCVPLARCLPMIQPTFFTEGFESMTSVFVNTPLWFLIIVLMFRVIYWSIRFLFMNRRTHTPLSLLNRILGLGFGVGKVYLILCCLVIVCKLSWIENGSLYLENSFLYYIAMSMTWGGIL